MLAAELANGWTVKEIAGLVVAAILTTVAWLKFRRLEFPPEWEHGSGPQKGSTEEPTQAEEHPKK